MIEVEWTPEVVRAEVDRRHEVARHSALVRAAREAAGVRTPWWRRTRPHEADEENLGSAA
ncbi:hypothetical protein [Actinophytocola sp.]|uniref:hypothetical protein n=1 Tax=Actinophytocola sp. TaxID=1872138 RepID=UPI002D7FFDD7|nr:hypothetical protein [Actinophytocola sp.]HET9138008.1 hypothetical protein [Actinophytocola sp.]